MLKPIRGRCLVSTATLRYRSGRSRVGLRIPDLDPRVGNNFIDANALDRIAGPEGAAMDRILRLYEESAFTLLLPYSVQADRKSVV